MLDRNFPLPIALAIALLIGTAVGALMGCIIELFGLPPFLVTLAGLFFFRGLALVISMQSIGLPTHIVKAMLKLSLPLGAHASLSLAAIVFIALLAIAIFIARFTRCGRNIYAIGGNESSAILMGLPVRRTKILLYALSCFCATLAGCIYALDTGSGNALAATGLELDAIAVVVVGGTLLTGGVGGAAGTLMGLLIFGIIQTALAFHGRLSSWWAKIAVGALLLVFVVMQRVLTRNVKT
jgi:simple sugar transport system permease protein